MKEADRNVQHRRDGTVIAANSKHWFTRPAPTAAIIDYAIDLGMRPANGQFSIGAQMAVRL